MRTAHEGVFVSSVAEGLHFINSGVTQKTKKKKKNKETIKCTRVQLEEYISMECRVTT